MAYAIKKEKGLSVAAIAPISTAAATAATIVIAIAVVSIVVAAAAAPGTRNAISSASIFPVNRRLGGNVRLRTSFACFVRRDDLLASKTWRGLWHVAAALARVRRGRPWRIARLHLALNGRQRRSNGAIFALHTVGHRLAEGTWIVPLCLISRNRWGGNGWSLRRRCEL